MAYSDLATIYDGLMGDIDYKQWTNYLINQISNHKAPGNKVLDLGCGTGNISIPLAEEGFQVRGVDISLEMLTQAEQKAREKGLTISFYQQDIRELVVDGQVDVVLSTFDTLNYLTDKGELTKTFSAVFKGLKEEGLFIFDLNTPYKLSRILGDNIYTYNTDELVYIWENYFDSRTKLCEMELTFFSKDDKTGQYRRFQESHCQRAYSIAEIKGLLTATGFTLQAVNGELSFEEPDPKEERIFFVAKKK